MRWPRLTRRSAREAARSDSTPGFKPGSWAESSLPPVDPDPVTAPTGNVEVIPAVSPQVAHPIVTELAPAPLVAPPAPLVAPPAEAPPLLCETEPAQPARPPAPFPSVPMPAPPAPTVAEDASAAGVHLGFEDGSKVQLDPEHPHSLALKAIADMLLHRGPSHRRVS